MWKDKIQQYYLRKQITVKKTSSEMGKSDQLHIKHNSTKEFHHMKVWNLVKL